jgi:hypothetical protein
MELINRVGRSAAVPALASAGIRPRPPRYVSELEGEIRQLYVRMIDEPIPSRLIGILRAGLAGHKP